MAWPFRVTDPLLDVLEVLVDADDELHGWAIMKQTQRTGPTVYQVLERLRKARWVECWWEERPAPTTADADAHEPDDQELPASRDNVPRRRYYRLSDDGAAKAPALLAERGRHPKPSPGRLAPGVVTPLARFRFRAGGAQ